MKTRNLFLSATASLLVMWAAQPFAAAQLALSGTNYTERFDNIGEGAGSLPTGWTYRINATATAVGDESSFTNGIASWTGADARYPYNMASSDNIDPNTSLPFDPLTSAPVQESATNRAPGVRLHSSVDGDSAWTLQIDDTIGFADFSVSVDLLVLTTNSRSGTWTVDYAVGDAPVSFTPLGTLGDLPGNSWDNWGATNSGVLTIPADADNQGQDLWIRLALLTGTGPTGSRDTYGIDDFVLNYTGGVVVTDPPFITADPQSSTNNAGTTALFVVEAGGAPILGYQWRKDGGDLPGETFNSLSLPEVVTADEGNYDVVITNGYGAITSSVASLTVVADPGLIATFESRTNMPGDAIRITADVAGTLPKTYQWHLDGVAIPGADGNLANDVVNLVGLTLTTNAAPADEGTYSLVVSNALGVVTSAVADVTIVTTPSTRIASWNFNSLVNDDDNTSGVDTPFVGSGSLFIAPLTGSFEWRGGAPVDIADLSVTNDNSAYRARGVNLDLQLESGIDVFVDTTGYEDILVSWNENNNSRASRYMRFLYTTNGTDFINGTGFSFADLDGSWLLLTEALYGIPGVENNPNFGFRIVAEWESTAIGTTNEVYEAAETGNFFSAANGVMIFDLLTVWGNPPGTAAPITVTGIDVSGGNVVVTSSSAPWDTPADFELLNASVVDGAYTNVGAAISEIGPGEFQAETPVGDAQEFFGIGR